MTEARDARLATLEACFGLALEAGSNSSSRDFTRRALALASRELGAKRVSFVVPGEERGEWTFAGALGIGESVLREGAVTVRDNVLHQVLQTREAVCCSGMQGDRRFGANKKLRYKTESFVVAPALVRGHVRCFFCATERDGGPFHESDLDFARDLVRVFTPIYELLEKGERAKEHLLREADLRRVRSAQERLHARPPTPHGLELCVLHHPASGPHACAWHGSLEAPAAKQSPFSIWLAEAPVASALPVFSSLASVSGRPPAQGLLDADRAAVRLEHEANALLMHGDETRFAVAGAQWPGLWVYEGRRKNLAHLAQVSGLLGKGANRVPHQHAVTLREGDWLVAISPSAFKDGPAFRKRLLEAILKNRTESARHLAGALEKELITGVEAVRERLLAVMRLGEAKAKVRRPVAKKAGVKKAAKKTTKKPAKKAAKKSVAPKIKTSAKKATVPPNPGA